LNKLETELSELKKIVGKLSSDKKWIITIF
jgi:hypothetical protein